MGQDAKKSYAPTHNKLSHFMLSFSDFTNPIVLNNQASPMPRHCARLLKVSNVGNTGPIAVLCKRADGATVTLSVPVLWVEDFPGAFSEITSVGGTGAADCRVYATWNDFGD